MAAAVAERWEPLTPEEIATLQLTARDVRSKVRSAVATIHQARGLHNSPIKPGTPLQAIEQYYLDAALGVTLSRSVWRHVCDLVLDVHSGGCAHHATGTTSNVREGA